MKQVLIGAAVSALAMFFWGFLFWAATPLPYAIATKVAPGDEAVGQKLKELLPESGVYMIPSPASGMSMEEMTRREEAGPLALIFFTRDGMKMSPATFVQGLAHYFVVSAIAGILLLAALPAAPGYGARMKIVFLAGLAGSLFSDLGKPIWWHYPWAFSLTDFSYDVTIWLIGALVLAKFVKGRG